jgi:hypothetical protein
MAGTDSGIYYCSASCTNIARWNYLTLRGGDTTVLLAVLAARTSPLSLDLFIHLKRDDEGGLL